jgi:hypothetical protein
LRAQKKAAKRDSIEISVKLLAAIASTLLSAERIPPSFRNELPDRQMNCNLLQFKRTLERAREGEKRFLMPRHTKRDCAERTAFYLSDIADLCARDLLRSERERKKKCHKTMNMKNSSSRNSRNNFIKLEIQRRIGDNFFTSAAAAADARH